MSACCSPSLALAVWRVFYKLPASLLESAAPTSYTKRMDYLKSFASCSTKPSLDAPERFVVIVVSIGSAVSTFSCKPLCQLLLSWEPLKGSKCSQSRILNLYGLRQFWLVAKHELEKWNLNNNYLFFASQNRVPTWYWLENYYTFFLENE